MFRCGFCGYINTNYKRLLFYTKLHDFFCSAEDGGFIEHERLLAFGESCGMSVNQTKDEIIGCLYAPFLMQREYNANAYYLTQNGRNKLDMFTSANSYCGDEAALMINFGQQIIIRQWLTDVITADRITLMKAQKWSLNKSKKLFTYKAKDFYEYEALIEEVLAGVHISDNADCTFTDLTKKYGHKYLKSDNIRCDLPSKAVIENEIIERYPSFLKLMLKSCRMPVDWGGEAIKKADICVWAQQSESGTSPEQILDDCINTSVMRFLTKNTFTMTSDFYQAMSLYFRQNKSLQLCLRKTDAMQYRIEIGEDTKALPFLRSLLAEYGFEHTNGWYANNCTAGEIKQILKDLYPLVNASGETVL